MCEDSYHSNRSLHWAHSGAGATSRCCTGAKVPRFGAYLGRVGAKWGPFWPLGTLPRLAGALPGDLRRPQVFNLAARKGPIGAKVAHKIT